MNSLSHDIIIKCDNCHMNKAIITIGLIRKKLLYCSRYCKSKWNYEYGISALIFTGIFMLILRYNKSKVPTTRFLEDPSSILFDSFAQLLLFIIGVTFLYYAISTIYSFIIIRKDKMDWVHLTFEYHMEQKSNNPNY